MRGRPPIQRQVGATGFQDAEQACDQVRAGMCAAIHDAPEPDHLGVIRRLEIRPASCAERQEFVEMLSISQSLPGLNATNMAILVGEKLRGIMGSLAAIVGICLPGGALMYAVGIFYRQHGDHAWTTAGLKGVAAAAVGLILSTVVQLSKKSLAGKFDFIFMALTVIAVNRLHQSVPRTLIVVGALAILFHRPRRTEKVSASE